MRTINPEHTRSFQKQLLKESLNHVFGTLSGGTEEAFREKLEWVEIERGETLFRQGDEGNALYFVISGRLAAYVHEPEGEHRKLGEISRGQVVGEMAIYTQKPRTADVLALRDSMLVKLSQAVYEEIAVKYPEVSIRVTRLIIERLKNAQSRKKVSKPVNICWVPLHPASLPQNLHLHVAERLQKHGSFMLLNSQLVDEQLGETGISQTIQTDSEQNFRLLNWLNDLEVQYDAVLYQCDPNNSEWTQRCVRQADKIVFVADARQSFELTELETQFQQLSQAEQVLVLVHPEGTKMPTGTRLWLEARPALKAHYHLRENNLEDMARTVRLLSGNGVGLVLAGGGAKGFAHIGVFKALREFKISVDYVGGASAGAMMGASIAMDPNMEDLIRSIQLAAAHLPTKDLSPYPVVSLLQGRRMRAMVSSTIENISGQKDLDLTDTWRPMYLVTSNYTKACETLHTLGSMQKLLRATSAIPGVFPPAVIGNDLHLDGAVFNNFPVDIMTRFNVRTIIGSDFRVEKNYSLDFEEVPSAGSLFVDRLRGRKKRRYRLPSIISILLNASTLNSNARRSEALNLLDLHFNPPASKFGFANWRACSQLIELGYQHAKERLELMSDDELDALRS